MQSFQELSMKSFGSNHSRYTLLPTLSRQTREHQTEVMRNYSLMLSRTLLMNLTRAGNATQSSNTTEHPVSGGTKDNSTGISFASTVIVTGLLCITILVTVFGNSIALAAFFVSRELRKIPYYFIVNLCISDLTVAVLSMPFWISYVITGWPNNRSGAIYTFWLCLDIFCGSWSIMSLAMISIERYVCIVYSLHYPVIVTKRRAVSMVVFVLFYSTLASLLGFMQSLAIAKRISISIFVAVYVVPVLIKVYTYAGIYKEAKAQKKFMVSKMKNKKRFDEEREFMLSLAEEKRKADEINRNGTSAESPDVESGERNSTDSSGRNNRENEEDEWSFKSRKRKGKKCKKESKSTKKYKRPAKASDVGKNGEKCTVEAEGLALNPGKVIKETSFSMTEKNTLKESSMVDGSIVSRCDQDDGSVADQISLISMVSKDCCEIVEHPDVESSKEKPASMKEDQGHTKSSNLQDQSASNKEPKALHSNTPRKVTLDRTSNDCQPSSQSKPKRFFKSGSLAEIKNKSILRLRRFQRELREAKVIGLIIGTFLVLWTPFMLVVVLSSLGVRVSMDMVMVAKCLHYSNSAINPILYVLLNRILRKSVRKVLRKAGLLGAGKRTIYF